MMANGRPLTPGVIFGSQCRPPLEYHDVLARLTPAEREQVLNSMIVFAPENFERALQIVSDDRAARRQA